MSAPRHILFVTGEYPPQLGGVGAYTAELGAALVTRGWAVSVLTVTGVAPAPFTARGVAVHPVMLSWGWHTARTVTGWAQRLAAGWVHVQYQTAAFHMHPAINFAPPAWRRAQLRTAWSYHDLRVPYLFPKAGDRLRRWVTARPAHTSDAVIVTNEADRRTLAGIPAHLASIPIGSNVAARHFSPAARRDLRAARGYTEGEFVVGYFGFLNRSKGGLVLVRTLKRLTEAGMNAQLLLIGERVGASDPTNYAYLQEVEASIAAFGLGSRVRWTGQLSDAGVSEALAACDVLLMPYEDGASLRRGTLMAGLAHGCAIVTTLPAAPLPELEEGRDLLYIPVGDDVAAAAALQRIAEDAPLAATLRGGAIAAARRYTWEEIARQHDELYTSLAV